MIPKVKNSAKQLIINVLNGGIFQKLNKSRKDFIISVLWHIFSIKGRVNFLQLGRFSDRTGKTRLVVYKRSWRKTLLNVRL